MLPTFKSDFDYEGDDEALKDDLGDKEEVETDDEATDETD